MKLYTMFIIHKIALMHNYFLCLYILKSRWLVSPANEGEYRLKELL